MPDPDEDLGPLIRLWGLTRRQLPDTKATADDLAPFLISMLQEAVPFIDSVAPKSRAPAASTGNPAESTTSTTTTTASSKQLWKPKGSKTYPDSAAKVELFERTIPATELELLAARNHTSNVNHNTKIGPETWVCRRSVHRDAAATGAASWAEFRDCIKDRHAETEDAFTPSVVGQREAMVWDCKGVEALEGGETWGEFTLQIEEMRHRIGRPLRDRTFPVLQMTCASQGEGKKEFLVVSVTVADFAAAPQAELSKRKGTVVAAYASVERVHKLEGWDGEVEWLMATASDARGVLPMWVQVLAVPGQIAKDVPMFLAWIARERSGERHPEAVGHGGESGKTGEAKLQEPLVPVKATEAPVTAPTAGVNGTAAGGEAVESKVEETRKVPASRTDKTAAPAAVRA